MEIWVFIAIGLVLLVGAAVLVFIGLRSPQNEDPLQQRLAGFAETGQAVSLEEIELSQPFHERVIFPIARRFGEIVLRFTPQKAIQSISKKLEQADNPGNIEPTIFFAGKIVLGLGLGVGLFILGQLQHPSSPIAGYSFFFLIGGLGFGFYLPEMLLQSAIDRRMASVKKAMPDALDLLTICVEAGLGFDAAMAKVYEKWDNELARAFGRVIREIQLGKIRREALRAMAERLGIAEMTSFVAAVIQSEQLGVSMAHVLRIQADQMRVKRRQAAEEEAHKAPIKMLIPIALLIFPSICIVLMTPAVLSIATMFSKM
jgi:tight adherence protein C